MTQERLLEEILDAVRLLRESDIKTQVRLAEIASQLANINGVRPQVEINGQRLSDHDARLKTLEELKIDARLRKVEGTTWKIVFASLMLIGIIDLLDKIVGFARGIGL